MPPWVGLEKRATRRTTPCGDGDMVWHVWGETMGDMPPVVLFHGGSGSWLHWVHNIEPLLLAGRQVWVPDLPGFGDSADPPSGGDADALIEPLQEALQELLRGQPCELVGFSFGGMTAGMLLAAHPGLATRLVLVGAPAVGVEQQYLDLRGWRHLATPQDQDAVHRHNMQVLMLHDPQVSDGLALEIHRINVARDRMPRRRLSRTEVLAQALQRVQCPVHAIYGTHDALYEPRIHELEAAYAAVTPDFRGLTLVPGAGHWVQFEAPEAFNGALLRALAVAG